MSRRVALRTIAPLRFARLTLTLRTLTPRRLRSHAAALQPQLPSFRRPTHVFRFNVRCGAIRSYYLFFVCLCVFLSHLRSYETGVVMSAVISRAVQNMKVIWRFSSISLHRCPVCSPSIQLRVPWCRFLCLFSSRSSRSSVSRGSLGVGPSGGWVTEFVQKGSYFSGAQELGGGAAVHMLALALAS